MKLFTATRGILALCSLLVATLALALGAAPPGAHAQAGAPASGPSAASLVKRPPAPQAKAYEKPKVAKKVERSKGAVAERDWTVMYYLDADCNLEAPMLDDIDEMERIGSTDNVNLLVLLDRTPQHDKRDGNWSNSRLLFVTRDNTNGKIKSEVLENLKEMDTSNPETLVGFVAFAMQNFPAKHYALVLGNHGGTWMGMLNDDTDNEAGMRLAPFIDGLAALKAAGAPKLDLIAFDMCLMAQVEVMDAIAPYASYGVASEELEPGNGYPNHRVLHALTRNPKMSPREFAQSMVKEWTASYAEEGEATVTSSATDLGKVPDLVAAIDALAAALGQAPESVQVAAARARASTHYYGGEQGGGEIASFDVGEFAGILARMPEAAAIKPQADAVAAAVKAAVVEHGEGEAHKGSTGLAIYFPANRKVHADYASIPFARGGWDEFLKRGFSGAAAAAATVTISAPDPGQNHRLGQGLKVTAQVAGAPASIRASIGFRDKDGSITTISDEEVASPGAWKDGTTFSYTVRPKVRGIGDGKNTRLAPTTPLSPGSPYLRADASYNSLMGDLQVATIFDSRTGKLETIFCLNENGASNPTAVHPVKGEKLVFYQTVSSGDDKPLRYRPVPALVSSGSQQGKAKGKAKDGSGLRLVDTGLPAGDYILSLTAYNGAGAPMGRSHLQLTAGGEAVAPGVGYPNYGYPAVHGYDLQYVDLTLIIPVAEYGQFEATWSDYNFMAAAQADDYSTQDLVFLDEVALDPQELAFDEENWSDEFEDDSLEHDGDVDDDGTLDASDLDDDNDGTPDAADLDDDNDGEPDAEEEDEDNDGTSDDEDLDDDNDGTPDAEDIDDDSDGIPDAEDEEADDEGEDEAADDEGEDEEADDEGEDEEADVEGEDEAADDEGEGEEADDEGEDEAADDEGEDEEADVEGEDEAADDEGEDDGGEEVEEDYGDDEER